MVKIILRSTAKNDLKLLGRALRRSLLLACREIFDDWTIGKQLDSPLRGLRSHRMDQYRIIYRIHASSEIDIIAIGHRSEIYERMEKRKKSEK